MGRPASSRGVAWCRVATRLEERDATEGRPENLFLAAAGATTEGCCRCGPERFLEGPERPVQPGPSTLESLLLFFNPCWKVQVVVCHKTRNEVLRPVNLTNTHGLRPITRASLVGKTPAKDLRVERLDRVRPSQSTHDRDQHSPTCCWNLATYNPHPLLPCCLHITFIRRVKARLGLGISCSLPHPTITTTWN